MAKRILALLCALTLLLTLCLTGCNVRQTSVEYLIGVSLANLSEQWRLVLKSELEAEAAKYDNVRLVFSDAAGDSEKQEADIHRLLEYGIDLLIVSPTDVDQLKGAISQVYAQLPVIVLDRAVEGYDYSLFIGPDNQLIGQQAGQTVLSLLEGEESPRVLELMAQGYANQERSLTFAAAMEEAGVELTQLLVSAATRDSAEDALLAQPELLEGVGVIFAHNDYMAYGASLALETLGLEQIRVVGLDGFRGEDGGLELVKNGIIAATITCPTGGPEAIRSAMEILTDTSGVPKKVILRSHAINSENVTDYIDRLDQPLVEVTEPIRVGYVQIGEESGWREASTQSIKDAAREFGVELTLVEAENQSQQRQIELAMEFIRQDMDVIVISPVVEAGWEQVLAQAEAAGIPVLLADRKIDVPVDQYTAFIGADFIEQGRRCANWLIQNTQGDVKILEIQGTADATPTKERKLGFENRIGEEPRCAIVYSAFGDFDREGGRRVVEEYLESHEWDIDAIYCHNDDMALGAVEVLKEHGLRPGVDVLILSIDGTGQALEALRKGELNCVAECSPLLGPQLMKALTDLMSGKELPLRIITDEIVFTAETPAKEFKNRAY